MNIIYDLLGSYALAFGVCAVLMIIVTVVMQVVIHKAHLFKKAVIKETSVALSEGV